MTTTHHVEAKDFFDLGMALHGHRCPAMPMGLRVAAAAMNALGVDRSTDGQLLALIELGDDHCATCFADGIQMITGCTFGKGNIKKLHYGKWGLTLINKKTQLAVRVAPKTEALLVSKQSEFMQKYRQKGVPASQVPESVVAPLVEMVMDTPDEALLNVGEVVAYEHKDGAHSFNTFVCETCGEMTVAEYGRMKDGKHVCIPCAQGENPNDPHWVARL